MKLDLTIINKIKWLLGDFICKNPYEVIHTRIRYDYYHYEYEYNTHLIYFYPSVKEYLYEKWDLDKKYLDMMFDNDNCLVFSTEYINQVESETAGLYYHINYEISCDGIEYHDIIRYLVNCYNKVMEYIKDNGKILEYHIIKEFSSYNYTGYVQDLPYYYSISENKIYFNRSRVTYDLFENGNYDKSLVIDMIKRFKEKTHTKDDRIYRMWYLEDDKFNRHILNCFNLRRFISNYYQY